jgi:hypothetical protein
LIKCKYCIDQKLAGDQQYKEKGSKTLDQDKNKTGMLGTERTGTDSLKLPIHMPSLRKENQRNRLPWTIKKQWEQAPLNKQNKAKRQAPIN